jgi:hypothetical protein
VEVADDAAPGLVGLGEQTRPRGRELIAAVGIRDRSVEKFGELGHALLGVGRWRLVASPVGDRDSPKPAIDNDRRPHARPHLPLTDDLGDGAGRPALVLEARGAC